MRTDFGSVLCLGTAAFMLAARCCSAGVISINTAVSAKVEGGTLSVTAKVENRGDETAYNAQAELDVQGQRILTDKVEELPVGKPVTFHREIGLNVTTPGSYPLIVTLRYTDANQYPFSALASFVFTCGAPGVPADIVGRIAPVQMAAAGSAVLSLKNLADSPVNLTTRLVAPRELTVAGGVVEAALPGRTERKFKFGLENFSAIGGSTYPILAVSEFDRDGVHNTVISQGQVSVVEKKQVLGLSYPLLGGVLVALVIVFIVFQKRKK